jgi:hypothetical protein
MMLYQLARLFSVELYEGRSLSLNLERSAIKEVVDHFKILYDLLDELKKTTRNLSRQLDRDSYEPPTGYKLYSISQPFGGKNCEISQLQDYKTYASMGEHIDRQLGS